MKVTWNDEDGQAGAETQIARSGARAPFTRKRPGVSIICPTRNNFTCCSGISPGEIRLDLLRACFLVKKEKPMKVKQRALRVQLLACFYPAPPICSRCKLYLISM